MFQLYQIIAVIIFLIGQTFITRSTGFCSKGSFNCGGIRINSPFWSEDYGDQQCDGYPGFLVKCRQDGKPVLNISNHHYMVQTMDTANVKIRDVDIDGQQCPQPRHNLSIESEPFLDYASTDRKMIIFYNCSTYPRDVVQYLPCLHTYNNNKNVSGSGRSFAFLEDKIPQGFNWYLNCQESVVTSVSILDSTSDDVNYMQALEWGINLRWYPPRSCEDCQGSGGQCFPNKTTNHFCCHCSDNTKIENDSCPNAVTDEVEGGTGSSTGTKVILGAFAGFGALLLILLFIYRRRLYDLFMSHYWWNQSSANVEVLLESYGCRLSLQRYKYSDIKKMTNSFKDGLGQGGYGSVFKGKLRDGRLVAIKVLNESKGNGEEFINEVATIGRTNHVNVVSLLGFCTDGTKRALVYEFMPNGSLEKFIYHEKEPNTTSNRLECKKLYEIALGIARGLDYLHSGCNTSILHFDIKPHNILLDEDFCPKISDFGLAKLCLTKGNIVSMHAPRGTKGYIAPEVFSLNFGRVSHKSDVYSYGMMVLEMIAGRKNIDETVENTSALYLPQWIYNHLKRDLMGEESGEIWKDETTRKMVIVALWCIQTRPNDRPSISKVVEMLEGNVEELQMPPDPFTNLLSSPTAKGPSPETGNFISCSSMLGR